jgi:hypothetical protein
MNGTHTWTNVDDDPFVVLRCADCGQVVTRDSCVHNTEEKAEEK